MAVIARTTHESIHFAFFSAPENQNSIPIMAHATKRKSGRMTIQVSLDSQKNNDPAINLKTRYAMLGLRLIIKYPAGTRLPAR